MSSDVTVDAWMIGISLCCVLCSYALISMADRSWLNWATSGYLVTFAAIFIFPLSTLLSSGPFGSRFAYFFCYSTYALTSLCLATAYVLARTVPRSKTFSAQRPFRIPGTLPWTLLAVGLLLYAPVLVRFSSLLLHPREIYTQTRTGYGPLVFGSRAFLNLAFVCYMFKQNKSKTGGILFFTLCAGCVFLHGSKGLLVNLLSMALLFWVYIRKVRLGFVRALCVIVVFSVLTLSLFAFFADLADVTELLTYVQGYSDYTKNAMVVIDDQQRQPLWGRLTIEAEVYARVPRVLFPAKPSNFGMFRLAQHYYPAWFRADTGNPDFNIGMQYADFGPYSLLFLCFTSTVTGVLTGFTVRSLDRRPATPMFILLLFFSGVAIVSFGSGYALPESALIAMCVWLLTRSPAQAPRTPAIARDSHPICYQVE